MRIVMTILSRRRFFPVYQLASLKKTPLRIVSVMGTQLVEKVQWKLGFFDKLYHRLCRWIFIYRQSQFYHRARNDKIKIDGDAIHGYTIIASLNYI